MPIMSLCHQSSHGAQSAGRGRVMAVKGATKLRPLAKAPGAQFEISIDGTPRTYRDRKAFAIEAAERLKRKHPNSDIMVRDLQNGEATTIKYKPDLGSRSEIHMSSRRPR